MVAIAQTKERNSEDSKIVSYSHDIEPSLTGYAHELEYTDAELLRFKKSTSETSSNDEFDFSHLENLHNKLYLLMFA